MDYCCSKGNLIDKIICDLNQPPDLSQRPPQNCPKYENPVDGQYCQGCALLRKKLKEDLFTYCIKNRILQDASEPSNDNTNVVNALQEPPHKVLHKSTTIVVTGVVLSRSWETILKIKLAFEDKHCQPEDILELFRRLHNDVQNIHEELAVYINTPSWYFPTVCYNNDDDEDCTIAITPKEPDNSLSMGDEHLDTIPATKSDEFIKSSVKNLVPSLIIYDEDISKEIYSNPLFDEEIISMKIDPHHINVELILYEFAGELTLLKTIPPGISETDCDREEEICLIKRLLYDNSSPRPLKEFVSENFDASIESFSTFPIPVEDSDSFMEEFDLSFTLDDPMPTGIEEDDYDSERDILFLEELLSNDSLSLPENESFHFDIPLSPRPPAKPPDDEFIKSSVENLVPKASESEGERECDVPACEDFTTFSNLLFDVDDDFSSSDDQSFYDEDIPKKIYLNPLFDEEIISVKIYPHHFNTESDLIESLLNHDSLIISSSSKIDSLFDKFAGKLTFLKSISPGINETDCDPEEETPLIKRLSYDNSSPLPPEEFISKNSDTAIESFSPFPIPVDDYDFERDILILEELLSNDSLSLPENELFHFDIPSSSRPPAKPPDEPKLYDGSVIQKTNAIVIRDSKETLMLEDESRSKMLQKQKDPMMSEKKTELSVEQVFWSPNSKNSEEPNLSTRPTLVEAPKELPKVSMVNSSLKKLKFHLASFDVVVKERTTTTAIIEGMWGFEHTKACFRDDITPFVKALKDLFNSFDQFLINELTKVKNVFNQMEQAVEQHRVKTNRFQDKMKEVLNENERLLEQAISKDIEKALVITALKNTLCKPKGKAVVDEAVTLHPIDPELLRIDVAPLAPKLQNNRIAHNDYLKHTQEETATLREIVKNERFLNPLDTSLDYASIKNDLRKLKGKDLVDDVVTSHTIAPEMLKVDVEPIAPKLFNNRTAHSDYLRHT
nr:hypothetical protein [Tanacetum cinerariifolium]